MKNKLEKAKKEVKEFFINFFKVLRRPEMIVLPGNLAFSFVLAIVPVFGLISYGASILNLSVDYLYSFVSNLFSKEIADMVLGVNLASNSGFRFFVTLLIGFYVASNGADSIITSSNALYGIQNKSWIRRRIKAFGLSFLILLLLVFMLIVPVFGNTITSLIQEVNLNPMISERIVSIFSLLKGPISWLIMFAIIRILYILAPDKRPKSNIVNYGAIFTTVGFIVGTEVYSFYINNYADYTNLYGSLASIVVLMIWIFTLAYIFTIGIALNRERDEVLLKTGTIKTKN